MPKGDMERKEKEEDESSETTAAWYFNRAVVQAPVAG